MNAILTPRRVNWCTFILLQMVKASRGSGLLPYPSVVMEFLHDYGIDTLSGPTRGTFHTLTIEKEFSETSCVSSQGSSLEEENDLMIDAES